MGGAPGRDDGMVVGDFSTVAHLGGQHRPRHAHPADHGSGGGQGGDGVLHIIGEIPAVRPGIGTQLLLIEGLEVVQRLDE